jgi:hypothetical protein
VLPPVNQRIGFGMEVCRCRTANGSRLSCRRAACRGTDSFFLYLASELPPHSDLSSPSAWLLQARVSWQPLVTESSPLSLPSPLGELTHQLRGTNGPLDHDPSQARYVLGSQEALCPWTRHRAQGRSACPGPSSLPRCSLQRRRYRPEARWGTAHPSRPAAPGTSYPSGSLWSRPIGNRRETAGSRLTGTGEMPWSPGVLQPVNRSIGYGMEECRRCTANGQRLSCECTACGSETFRLLCSPPTLAVPGCYGPESSTASSAC